MADKNWDIPGIGELIHGIKTEVLQLEVGTSLVHVRFPVGTPKDRSAAFAKALRDEMPSNIRLVFTTPGVQISVLRPHVVNLHIEDCHLSRQEVDKKISAVLDKEADIIDIRLKNIQWVNDDKNVKG